MAVPSPKKTPKNLKKPMKPKRRPLRESPKPKKRPDIVDLTPPEEADQLLIPKEKASGGKITKMGMGGKCRGMGAAGRGGAFTRNG
tara:strand:+ start:86 stop:343 length:258 start_codon:yes stop_codon:yes gene_type:complete